MRLSYTYVTSMLHLRPLPSLRFLHCSNFIAVKNLLFQLFTSYSLREYFECPTCKLEMSLIIADCFTVNSCPLAGHFLLAENVITVLPNSMRTTVTSLTHRLWTQTSDRNNTVSFLLSNDFIQYRIDYFLAIQLYCAKIQLVNKV